MCTWYTHRVPCILVVGGNEAGPQYLQQAICNASWSTGACILSSVVGAPQQKRQQQQQHILGSRRKCFSPHICTNYFSGGSVQHPSPYSFRKRVLVRPVMKRLFFFGKPRKRRVASFARLTIIQFYGPYDILRYIRIILRFYGPHDTFVLQFFVLSLQIWGSPVLVGGLLVSQVICPSLRLAWPRPQLTSTAPNSQQQEFDNKQQQHPPANSSTPNRPVYITPGNCDANPGSPRAPLPS